MRSVRLSHLKAELSEAKPPKGSSLAVEWPVLHASTVGGASAISGQGTNILHATKGRNEAQIP